MSQKISAAARMALQKASGVREAIEAESNLQNVPIPNGWEGDCKVMDLVIDVSKAGNLYARLDMLPINDEKYGNKPVSKIYKLYETSYQGQTESQSTKIAKFLTDLERAGMPRTVRDSCVDESGNEDLTPVVSWWTDPDAEHIVHLSYKPIGDSTVPYMSLGKPRGGSVDQSASVVPTLASTQKKGGLEVGAKVMYAERECTVKEIDGDKLKIEMPSGKIKDISVSDLD